MRTRLLVAVPLLTVALAGCSFSASVGEARVSSADLETQVTEQLTEYAGQAPDDVECPDALPGEVDAQVRCTLTAGPDRLGVTVTVTEVDGTDIRLGIQVDDEVLADGEEA